MILCVLKYGVEYKKYFAIVSRKHEGWFSLPFDEQLLTCKSLNNSLKSSGLRAVISCHLTDITFYKTNGHDFDMLFSVSRE